MSDKDILLAAIDFADLALLIVNRPKDVVDAFKDAFKDSFDKPEDVERFRLFMSKLCYELAKRSH